MITTKIEQLKTLAELWSNAETTGEMQTILNQIQTIREEMGTTPIKILKLQRELHRFNTFKNDQNNEDNILSLLKICNRLQIQYNKNINTKTTTPTEIINNIYTICEQEYTQETQKEININEIFQHMETPIFRP